MRRLPAAVAAALVLGSGFALPARAVPVDLELVLAIDISGSTDTTEFALQRDGWAAALESPAVVAAIQGGALHSIAVGVVYWQGEPQTVDFTTSSNPNVAALGVQVLPTIKQVVPWMQITDATSATAVANALRAATAQFTYDFPIQGGGVVTVNLGFPDKGNGFTGVARALDFSRNLLLASNGFEGTRLVIDLSGDGYENLDHDPAGCNQPCDKGNVFSNPAAVIVDPAVYFAVTDAARDATVAAGITINGLPILTDVASLATFFYGPWATGGPGSFVLPANGFADIQAAATAKLISEVVPEPASLALLACAAGALARRRSRA